MDRRSKNVAGFVNFPVDDPKWKNTAEGGLFVRLVVEESRDLNESWQVCCGGWNYILQDETYIRDDNREPPTECLDFSSIEALYKQQELENIYIEHHFPYTRKKEDAETSIERRYLSIGYLAVLTIGSTGWSGWHKKENRMWYCTKKDLTKEGKKLYKSLECLYPGCTLTLQTWLDT